MCLDDDERKLNGILWPSSVLCIQGQGDCIAGKCHCTSGSHDLAFGRFRNCSLSQITMKVFFSLTAIAIILLFIRIYQQLRVAKLMARRIIIADAFVAIGIMLFMFVHGFVYSFKMTAVPLFIFYFTTSSLSVIGVSHIFSLALPLYATLRKSSRSLFNSIGIIFTINKITQIIPIILASTYYNDPDNESMDKGWNLMIYALTVLLGIEAITICGWASYNGQTIINFMEKAILKSMHENLANNITSALTKAYLVKVSKLVKLTKLIALPLGLILNLLPILYFTTGYVPYDYVFCIIAFSQAPIGLFASIQYASMVPTREKREISMELQGVKKMDDIVVVNDGKQQREMKDIIDIAPRTEVLSNSNGKSSNSQVSP